jgi:hypothetical protein
LQLIFSQESDSKPFLEKPTKLEGEREKMQEIEKIIKKIKAENNKINKLRYKKKKDPELFQLNADDLELLHAQEELESLQKEFKAFYANNSPIFSFSQDFFEVAREA